MNAVEWTEITRRLVEVAMGRTSADMVIKGGRWVCVQSGEILDGIDIAVAGQRIAYVGQDAGHTIGKKTQVVEARGRYLVPGLLDAHMHIESGMLTITEFVRAVLPRGTTGMFIDPHEIANVLGLKGVRMMVDEAAVQPVHVWVQVPSCVPSAPRLETPGAEIGPQDVAEAMTWPGIIGLGEVMDYAGVYSGEERVLAKVAEARARGKVVGGHYASLDLGLPFHGYVAGGAEDDHEGTRMEDAVARVQQGMKAMLRYGSAWLDVDAQVRAITELGLDSRHFILCTDDSHASTLVHDGHVNRAVCRAIEQGLEPLVAIQMATLNPAEHFGVARDVGQIAPGRYADILIASDLSAMTIDQVIAKGVLAAEEGNLLLDVPAFTYPKHAENTVRLGKAIAEKDFVVGAPADGRVKVNVIGVVENQAPTKHLKLSMRSFGGQVPVDMEQDIAKVALVERHHRTGTVKVGFVQGFGFKEKCAVGSTVAHDSHHMIVVGTDETSMAVAANELARVGGGQIVVMGESVRALVELPIAGLMSDRRAEVVADQTLDLIQGFVECGCEMSNPNMQISLLALVVIPDLRISDKGLVDVNRFEVIPTVEGMV